MDQENIENSNSQDQASGQDVQQIENVSPTSESVTSDNSANNEESTHESSPGTPELNKTYTQSEVDKIVQEKFNREKRKVRREAMQEYSIPNSPLPYNSPYMAPIQQPIQPQVNTFQNQQISQLTPEQQAEVYLANIVSQNVQTELAKIKESQIKQEAHSFYQKVKEQASKNDDFDDFLNYECDILSRQVGSNQLSALFEVSRKFNDPSILFEIHKQNPEEFRSLASMNDPIMQAAKIGEFRARKTLQTRKVVSNAPPPVVEPTSKTSSYSSNQSVTDKVAQKLAERNRGYTKT